MSRIEEIVDNKKVPEEGEKKQKTAQEVMQELEEKTSKKLAAVTSLREKEARLQKEIIEAQQDYINTREELFTFQMRFVQNVNQNLATELSKFKKPASSAPAT